MTRSSESGPARRSGWRLRPAVRNAVVAACLLHTVTVLWIWVSWESGVRGGWLVWMDFPVSLLFLDARSGVFLGASLVLGGLWWGAIGGVLSWVIGRGVRAR